MVYSHLLLDVNVLDLLPWYRLPGGPPWSLQECYQPVFYTALFRVSKQVSMESLEYFYTENAFVAVQSCLKPTLNYISVQTPHLFPKSSAHQTKEALDRKLPLTLHMDKDEQGLPHSQSIVSKKKVVFALRHLPKVLTMLKYDEGWRYTYHSSKTICLHFTLNLRGEYDFSQKPRTVNSIYSALKAFHGFTELPLSARKMVYRIGSDSDKGQDDKLKQYFQRPISGARLLEDLNLLRQEANKVRDNGVIDAADTLYEQIDDTLQYISAVGSHIFDFPGEFLDELDLFDAERREHHGTCHTMDLDYFEACDQFTKAIHCHKKVGRYSVEKLAQLCVLRGETFVDGADLLTTDGYAEDGGDHLRSAIDSFKEAKGYTPDDSSIEEKIRSAQRILDESS